MRSSRAFTFVLTIALPLVVSVPIVLAAGGGAKGTKAASGETAKYADLCKQANQHYEGKDIPAAIELYKKAILIQPRNPLAHYLLGEAQLGSGNLQEAETEWLQAEQVADGGPASIKAKILFVLADLRERQKKWDDARAAWEKYAEVAAKLGADGGAFPGSSQSRLQMIDDMTKQDKAYDVVRQRIKEEDGGTLGGKIVAGAVIAR
jgi:tetratricopeptide (TPR) repeat protein